MSILATNSLNQGICDLSEGIPTPLIQFNEVILRSFTSPALGLDIELLDFLHVSQFVRMLPFKVQSGDLNKAILFYALSCKLMQEMRIRYGN